MKLKHILILLFAAPFLGCDGPVDLTYHYIYGNSTDKTVSVQAFAVDDRNGSREVRAKFSLQPGEQFTLSYFPIGVFGGRGIRPFDYANEVIISNGDTTIVQTYDNLSAGRRWLFRAETYNKTRSKNDKNFYFEFVFTDKDFEDAEPVE